MRCVLRVSYRRTLFVCSWHVTLMAH